MPWRLFGVTGGIASGKSTVIRFLRERGLAVIDADQVARDVVAPGTQGLAAVAREFGPSVLTPQGTLDRKALAATVFAESLARKRLESLTHPLIRQATQDRAMQLAAAGHELIAYEAALLVELGQAEMFRPLVVAVASEAVQLHRMVARDGMTREQAEQRLRAQMPSVEKEKAADHVIDTECSLEELEIRTDDVLRRICERCGVNAERYFDQDGGHDEPVRKG